MGHAPSDPSVPGLDAMLHPPDPGGAVGGPGPGQWQPAFPAPQLVVHGRAWHLLSDFHASQPDCPQQLPQQKQRQAEERRQLGGGSEYGRLQAQQGWCRESRTEQEQAVALRAGGVWSQAPWLLIWTPPTS